MPADDIRPPTLTPLGRELRRLIEPELSETDLAFPTEADDVPSSRMVANETFYNNLLLRAGDRDGEARQVIRQVFLGMDAVQQMMMYLYHVAREQTVRKSQIYTEFFSTPFVNRFCEQEGIEQATLEAARRRCPFLLNVLEACGAIRIEASAITVDQLLLIPRLVQPYAREDPAATMKRFEAVRQAWPCDPAGMANEDLSIVRELFGSDFLTPHYRWAEADFFRE